MSLESYKEWAVVLVEPHYSINVGYVARVMANFGLKKLIIVGRDPKRTKTSIKYASHGSNIVVESTICSSLEEVRSEWGLLAATTAIISKKPSRIERRAYSPEEFAKFTAGRRDVAIVMGRDTTGLRRDEILKCDVIVHVPTWSNYPTLNISHALAIILYVVASLYHEMREKPFYVVEPPHREETTRLVDSVMGIASMIPDYREPGRAEKLMVAVKRMLSTAMISRHEVRSLLGFFRRVESLLKAVAERGEA